MSGFRGHYADPWAPGNTSPARRPMCEQCACEEPLNAEGLCPDCVRDGWRFCLTCGEMFRADAGESTYSECAEIARRIDNGVACTECGMDLVISHAELSRGEWPLQCPNCRLSQSERSERWADYQTEHRVWLDEMAEEKDGAA